MSMIVDLVVIALIAIFTIIGLKRGFAREVIDFLITLLLIPICMVLMIPISGIIVNTTKIDKTINSYIVETVVKLKDSEEIENKKNESLLETEVNKIIKQNKDKGIDEVAKIAGKNITDGIIKGIAFVSTYVILSIIILIFKNTILGLIESIGIFKGTNSILGGIFGAVKALLIIFVILTIIQIVNITGKNDVRKTLNNTIVVKEIEKFNPITGILLKK